MKKITLFILISVLIAPFSKAQKSTIDLPINWDDSATVNYSVSDFDGTSSSLENDPSNSSNTVLRTVKNAGQVWAGTTLSTSTGFAKKIPFAAGSMTLKALVYSPDSGVIVKLKVENANTGSINADVDVRTTVANAWDTLTFDFTAPTNGSINLANNYEKATIFYDFGTMGTGKTYYVDSVWLSTGVTASKAQIELPITWDDSANVDYSVTDFDGTSSSLDNDPSNSSNTVLKTVKNAGQVWAGTTLSTSNGLAKKIPFTAGSMTLKALVYSPDSGVIVKLKVENANTGSINADVDVRTTVANAWDTLTFDFTAPTNGSINLANNYEKATIFYDFGTMGSGKTYYVDNVWFVAGGTPPPPAKNQIDLPITWDDTLNIDYSVGDFGGNASAQAADPTNASNLVLKSEKTATSMTWAGTTVSTSMGLKNKVPFATGKTIVKALVYSPDAGTIVRLKAEDHTDNTVTVETEATTTVANTWETLSFDFSQQAAGTAIIDFAKTYDMVSIFYNFGVDGATAGAKTYYVDSIYMGTGGGTPPIPDTNTITFKVDMNTFTGTMTTPEVNGTFNNWCGSCTPMTDADNDNIWEVSVDITTTEFEYKFSYDNWAGQETLDSTLDCIKQTGTFVNRILKVSGDTTLPAMCWESCETCFPEGIESAENSDGFALYPNPASDLINILGSMIISDIVIVDVLGKEVYSSNPNNTEASISLGNFENGMYIISIVDSEGNNSVQRFIKQ